MHRCHSVCCRPRPSSRSTGREQAGRVPLRRLIIPKAVSVAADAACLLLAMGLAYNVGRIGSLSSTLSQNDYVLVALVSLPMWLLVFARYGLYASRGSPAGCRSSVRSSTRSSSASRAARDRGVRVDLNVSRPLGSC